MIPNTLTGSLPRSPGAVPVFLQNLMSQLSHGGFADCGTRCRQFGSAFCTATVLDNAYQQISKLPKIGVPALGLHIIFVRFENMYCGIQNNSTAP